MTYDGISVFDFVSVRLMIVLNLDSDAIIFNNVYIYYMGERVD